ncbi:unnamed protein product, partial [Rotaria socialis]
IMTEREDLTIEKSSVIAVLNENGRSYWLAKVINADDENKNIEIQYFDHNTFKIENTSTELVARESILSRIADTLLMKLYLNESDDDDHHSSKAISAILSLIESGAMDDSAVAHLLLSHHHKTDKVQQQNVLKFWGIFALIVYERFVCFILNVYALLIFIAERLIVSFHGQKDWQFTQLYTKIIMELRKTD